MSDLLDVDCVQQRRVSTAIAAKYLGCSVRQVVALIHEGELPGTIDVSSKGSKRAAWAIPVRELRALICRREAQAQRLFIERGYRMLEEIGTNGTDGLPKDR